ncbi:MAG: hypothetical protein K6G11_04560, partial [Lachnospiraceae bacterium]|nr:hypothetical protein [Lachnospiraceae bacterium]
MEENKQMKIINNSGWFSGFKNLSAGFSKVIRNHRGDTMIEILIAFTMLTICLATLSGVMNVASKMVQMSKETDANQAEYDKSSAQYFSQDDAYNKDAVSTLTYNFDDIFSMEINSTTVEVGGTSLDVFTTQGESSSSYIKSLKVADVSAPMNNSSGDSNQQFDKVALSSSIISVTNNVQKEITLSDEEKQKLTISLTSEAQDAGISLVNDDTG